MAFCDVTLTLVFLSMIFVLIHYSSYTFTNTLGELELLAALLTSPRVQKVKTLHFELHLDLDLTRYLNLKMLAWVRLS